MNSNYLTKKELDPGKIKKISKKLLQEGYSLKITVSGNSMFPFLVNDETVKVSPLQLDKLKIGDIIIFENNKNLIAHRLIKYNKSKNVFITKGDFCFINDPVLSEKQILGKIVIVYRKRKNISLDNRYHRVLSLVIVKMRFIIPYLVRILKKLGLIKIPNEYFHN